MYKNSLIKFWLDSIVMHIVIFVRGIENTADVATIKTKIDCQCYVCVNYCVCISCLLSFHFVFMLEFIAEFHFIRNMISISLAKRKYALSPLVDNSVTKIAFVP